MSRISLRTRMVAVVVVVTSAACAALVFLSFELHAVEVDRAVRNRGNAVAAPLGDLPADFSPSQVQEIVERWFESGSIVAAVVFSPTREVVAAYPQSASGSPTLARWPDATEDILRVDFEGVSSVAVFVEHDNGFRGWLAFDNAPNEDAARRMRIMWGGVGIGAVLISLFASALAGLSATGPLHSFKETVDRLRDGELGARCETGGPIEINALATSINQMAAAMEATLEMLSQERFALEQQVSGRTRELEQANRLLLDIANRDALTGLANRRRLEIELEKNISFSKRTGQPLAVIMMDLDNFKICNDTAGHLVGDNILRAVASTLRSRVRVTDLVVRWGGDEFCILVPATQPQGAIAAAESLVDAVREATARIALPEPLEPPTASAGVACFPEDGEDAHRLILNADAALYQVKATGRGRVLKYAPGFSKG